MASDQDSTATALVSLREGIDAEIAMPAAVLSYFVTFNAGDLQATSELFAADGALYPPFEEPIVSPTAIARYLQAEAQGMKLQPSQSSQQELEQGYRQVEVFGKVQTAWFGVNVAWSFLLNPQQQISAVKVKLLASPKELLGLRR